MNRVVRGVDAALRVTGKVHAPPHRLSEFPSSFLCLVLLVEVAVLERSEIERKEAKERGRERRVSSPAFIFMRALHFFVQFRRALTKHLTKQ